MAWSLSLIGRDGRTVGVENDSLYSDEFGLLALTAIAALVLQHGFESRRCVSLTFAAAKVVQPRLVNKPV